MLKKSLLLLSTIVILGSQLRAEEPKINLHLSSNTKSYYSDDNAVGMGLFISGVALTAAILLETDRNYTSSWHTYNGGSVYYQTVTPFFEQTPRQIFFLGGVALMATGIYISINDGSFRFKR